MYRNSLGMAGFLLLVTLFAGILRWVGLDKHDLWLDEACSYYWSHHFLNWPLAREDVWREPTVGYLITLTGWARLFGESEIALRSLSLVCGAFAVSAVGWAGWRYLGARVGIIAGILAAVHPLQVYYSQEARGYAMWTLLVALLLIFIFEASRTMRARWWCCYGAVLMISMLTHLYTLYLIPSTLILMRHHPTRRRFFRIWLTVHGCVALLLLPVVVKLVLPRLAHGPGAWTHKYWVATPPSLALPKSLWALLPSGSYPVYLGTLRLASQNVGLYMGAWTSWLSEWLPAIVLGCAGARCIVMARRRTSLGHVSRADPLQAKPTPCEHAELSSTALGVLTLAPLFISWCQALATGQGYVVARYDLISWPAMMLLLGILVDALSNCSTSITARRLVTALMITLLMGSSLLTNFGRLLGPAYRDLSDRAEALKQKVTNRDMVISLGLYRWWMNYQWDRLAFHPDVVSFPLTHDEQVCWNDPAQELNQPDRLQEDLSSIIERARSVLGEGRQVWILANENAIGPRWEVDRLLFEALPISGIQIEPVDEWLGLVKLHLQSNHEAKP